MPSNKYIGIYWHELINLDYVRLGKVRLADINLFPLG